MTNCQLPTKSDIELLEVELLKGAAVELPVTHHFAPGVYGRELSAPAGTLIIGHEHKDVTLNIVLAGRAKVLSDGGVREVKAGEIFNSGAGVRKVAIVLEDLRWLNVHPNPDNERDMATLEDRYIVKSKGFIEHHERKALCLGTQ